MERGRRLQDTEKSCAAGYASIDLTVHPGVHHAFDVAQLKPGRGPNGRWLEYDEPAARDAEKKTRAFLADHLVSMPAAPR